MADRWALSGPAGEAPTFKPPSSLLQESEDVSSVLLRLFEGRPVAAILEEKHSRVGEVVEDVDAFLERDHAVVAAVDQEGRGLDGGGAFCVIDDDHFGLCAGLR